MKATEQYFHVVLFIMLYKVVLTFKSVDKTLVCDHSNESYRAVLSWGTVYYAVQGGSNFLVCGRNHSVWPFKWKLLSNMWYCLLCWYCSCGTVYHAVYLYEVVLPFRSVDETLVCDHSNESHWVAISCSTVQRIPKCDSSNKYYSVVLIRDNTSYETLVCDHSNESYCTVLPCGTVYYAVRGDSSV